MKPNRDLNTTDVEALIRQLAQQQTTRERFSISMPVQELCTAIAAAYQLEVKARRVNAVDDAATIDHIRRAAHWLCNSQGKTGLMLQGLYGNGKTTLMRSICRVIDYLYASPYQSERHSVRLITAKEIARLGSREDTRRSYRELYSEELLAIDDLGEEAAEMMVFGSVMTPVKDLLLERYARNKFTIVSTNLINSRENPQLTRHYGERVTDRLREMMEIIVFTNPSYRGRR